MNTHTKQKIREYLEAGNEISQLNGMEVANTTCAKDYCRFLRRDDGLPIKSEWRRSSTGKRYKVFFLQNKTA